MNRGFGFIRYRGVFFSTGSISMAGNLEQHNETSPLRVSFPRRYRFIDQISEHGGTELWSARDRCLKRTVYYRRSKGDDEGNRRIEHEFSVISSLRHPAVPVLYDLGKEGEGAAFYTFEYVPGTSLSSTLSKFGETCLPEVLNQICRALEYFHSRGCYFRLLNPVNPIVVPLSVDSRFGKTASGGEWNAGGGRYVRVKFTDFGQAIRADEREHPVRKSLLIPTNRFTLLPSS